MQNGKKKGYEYELCIARLDTEGRTIRVSSIDLSATSAFQTKPGRKTEKASGGGIAPLLQP
jgi:hypothetical protein